MSANKSTEDFRVADLLLAEWGKKEITIAEGEMPALMAIRAEYARWFADPGHFHELRRCPIDDGASEVVEYTLSWQENGVPHAAHHMHLLTVRDDLIVADTVFCGGRWPASLLAEMEAADA